MNFPTVISKNAMNVVTPRLSCKVGNERQSLAAEPFGFAWTQSPCRNPCLVPVAGLWVLAVYLNKPSCLQSYVLSCICLSLFVSVCLCICLSFWDKVFLSKPGWTQSQDLAASLYQRWDCSTRDSPVLPLFEDLQLLPLTPLPLCRGFFPLWTLTWVLSCGSLSVFIFWLV